MEGLRVAKRADLPVIVTLLIDDPIGVARESDTDLAPYERSFDAIEADPAHQLVVVERDGEVVATLQLTFLPGLARQGMLRAQIEGVRVHRDHRDSGLGAALVTWAVEESRYRGCGLVQLTTDKQRKDAHRFYARLGFAASHEGFKLAL